jgi:hypothetical protein
MATLAPTEFLFGKMAVETRPFIRPPMAIALEFIRRSDRYSRGAKSV